jgi:hypothetical protein
VPEVSDEILAAIKALIKSILADEDRSGGLLSRETLRLTALLYQAVIEPQS